MIDHPYNVAVLPAAQGSMCELVLDPKDLRPVPASRAKTRIARVYMRLLPGTLRRCCAGHRVSISPSLLLLTV